MAKFIVCISVIAIIGIFVATVPTFERRCAEAFDRKSAAFERCVERLANSEGGVRYITKIERIPVTD